MKKKSASQSAFFNLRVLTGLFMVLGSIFMVLLAIGVFSPPSTAQAQQHHKFIIAPELGIFAPGFDCSTIHQRGIDTQENFRAGAIMIACGESQGGSPSAEGASSSSAVSKLVQSLMPSPLFIGSGDVDVVLPDGTFPHVTQSESMEWCDGNHTCVVNYNDSRTASSCYGGISYSTDNGTTWQHAGQPLCTGHGTNFGDPIVVYNARLSKWFAGDLATGCGGQGIGMWSSPDGITWTVAACAHNGGSDDRESLWVDNNAASPNYGRMYVSWNDFGATCGNIGCLKVVRSDDGVTWSAPVQLSPNEARNNQITGDLQGSGRVYVQAMNEGGGGLAPRQAEMFRSTDGGVTWGGGNVGSTFQGPGRSTSGYFAIVFSTIWRHMGWGEPAASGNVVGFDYAACGNPSGGACSGQSDHGDIYFVRSTDAGVTWAPPVKLNTDGGTAMQWQPSLAATQAGAIFASWYDERETNGGADLNCTPGSSSQNCYRRWGRVSFDNGATWQPDDMVGRSLTPLPGQPDSTVQGTYEGDYDYHSSTGTNIIGGWTDGRNIISNQSQQDVFVNFVQGGFGVTSTIPACNSTISNQPTDFVINLSGTVDGSTVQATDFTVNGIPANSFMLGMSNTQITFHFNSSPVTTQGPQTMHIAAGAFNDTGGHGVADFTCSFCYALSPLQVTSTNPPVGGSFSPPAPGDYTFDVNFNQAVDPSSVQDSDLTITGNVGGSVTGHSLMNGNQTVRFNVHFNFGGAVTLSIAANAITVNTCNGNAAFSGNYTVEGCPPADHYTISQIQGSIVPGTTDSGNHGDDVTTTIALPFSYTVYDQTYNAVTVSSNGNAQFAGASNAFSNECLPSTQIPTYAIFPYWDDQRTDASGSGIFYSTSGNPPNRIFNIEWRTTYFSGGGTGNYELRLYEGQTRFDVIYGTVSQGNTSATGGVEKNSGAFDQYFCNGSGQPSTGAQSYILQSCNQVTVTDAVSRKTQGAAGTFDIEMPLTGSSGVECRSGGGTHDYSLVVTFSGNVTVTGSPQAQVVSGNGCVGTGGTCDANGTVTVNANVVTVPLTNIADVQVINVQINGVNGAADEPAVNVNIPMGILIGDVSANRTVNATDVAQTKSQVGAAVGSGNFREDVNASGTITATDVSIVKSDVGHSLP